MKVKSITTGTMKLTDVVNPNRIVNENEAFWVENPTSPPGDRNVFENGSIAAGDTIVAESDASTTLVGNDGSNDVEIVSIANADPATVEVNWEQVESVSEYYDELGYTTEVTVPGSTGPEIILIRG